MWTGGQYDEINDINRFSHNSQFLCSCAIIGLWSEHSKPIVLCMQFLCRTYVSKQTVCTQIPQFHLFPYFLLMCIRWVNKK